MNHYVIPWRCEACGATGTLHLDLSQDITARDRLAILFHETLKDHGPPMSPYCHLVTLFWDFPPNWSTTPGATIQ